MKKYRTLQIITGFHCVHHIYYSYGVKIPFFEICYFKKYGFKKIKKSNYHNCTKLNIY